MTVVPQVFVWANGPVFAMLLMVRIPRPLLVSVTVLALLLVKTTWVGKVSANYNRCAYPLGCGGFDVGMEGWAGWVANSARLALRGGAAVSISPLWFHPAQSVEQVKAAFHSQGKDGF